MHSRNGFDFLKLIVETRARDQVSVVVVKETAEYFGWDKAFPEWKPRLATDALGRIYVNPSRSRWRHFRGGDRLRICRAPSTNGHPAGDTFSFRMVGGWSRKHLAELAKVAGSKFEWMEDASYRRMRRDYWLALDPVR